MSSAKEIYEAMKQAFRESTGRDISDNCDMAVRMYVAAAQAEALYIYNDFIKKQCFPQTATGEYLDRHAAMRGIERIGAEKAAGTIRFYIPAALGYDVAVGSGTVCFTAGGEYFTTTAQAVITAGTLYCDAPAKANAAGLAGNAAAGAITNMVSAPTGVTGCTNISAFTGGLAAESDESLRARVLAGFKKLPNGANKAYYEKTAMSVPGVSAVSVLPKNRGVGTVDVIIAGENGAPSAALIAQVQNILNEAREICVDVDVSGAEARTINIVCAVDIEDGYSFGDVSQAVEDKLESIFSGAMMGKTVTRAYIGNAIYNVDGVKNYSITSPASDVVLDSDQVPVTGTVTVGAWS